ncbi:MAG: hypothetical protein KKF74_04705 [Nanoarchaeota archaeon]|nr:hypothetical protein [Nanoarchaeota archaeon]
MAKRKQVQKNKYFYWCTEKFGRKAYWHKSNWRAHLKHETILNYEQIYIDTLIDPDRVFPSYDKSCYYKIDAFKGISFGIKKHAKVVVVENPNYKPAPTKERYVIVASAMDTDVIPEEGKVPPKFVKERKK